MIGPNDHTHSHTVKPLGMVFQVCRVYELGRFERPTLRGCHYRYMLRQGWRFASTLPYQKTNPDGVIGGVNWVEVT